MVRLGFVFAVLVAAVLTNAPRDAHSRSGGATAGATGAPGNATCATSGCHDSFALNSGTGGISLTVPVNEGFLPGQPFEFGVIVENTTPGAPERVQGFSVTARDPAGEPVGVFEIVDPEVTRFASGSDQYVTHTLAGINERAWNVRWLAPDPAPASVTFYAAGNAANGNGWLDGDYIYTTAQQVDRQGVAVEDTQPDAVALEAVWPNPATDRATLAFSLAVPAEVRVSLVDGQGRRVAVAHRGALGAGPQSVALDVAGLAAGVYFAEVATPEGRRVLPLTVVD